MRVYILRVGVAQVFVADLLDATPHTHQQRAAELGPVGVVIEEKSL